MPHPRYSAAPRFQSEARTRPFVDIPAMSIPETGIEFGTSRRDSHEALSESYIRQIDSARQRGDLAEEARVRQEFEGFLAAFRAVEQLNQLVPVRSILAGEPLPSEADVEEIRELLITLEDWRPDSIDGHLVRGCALLLTGKPDNALLIFNRMLAEGEGGVYLHCARGQALLALGRSAQAEESFKHGFELDQDESLSLIGRGRACMELGRPDEALVAFRRALHLERFRAEIWFLCGDALLMAGRSDEALLFLRRGLALAPDNEAANISVARALSLLGRGREALLAYEQVFSHRDDAEKPAHSARAIEPIVEQLSKGQEKTIIRRTRADRPLRFKTRHVILAAFGIALIGFLLGLQS